MTSPSPSTETKIILNDDFESTLSTVWKNQTPNQSYSLNLVDAPEQSGKAARFELRRDDPWVSGSIRSELSTPYPSSASPERWYYFSVYIPEDWEFDAQPEVFAQWHNVLDKDLGEGQEGVGGPPLTMYIEGDQIRIVNRWDPSPVTTLNSPTRQSENIWIGEYEKGAWSDWVVRVDWSYQSDGILQIWRNEELIINKSGANTFNDQIAPYMKIGIYKWVWKDPAWLSPEEYSKVDTRVLYFDNVRIEEVIASVKEPTDPTLPPDPSSPTGPNAPTNPVSPKPDDDPNSPFSKGFRIEAETLNLQGYQQEFIKSASNGAIIGLRGNAEDESGLATYRFDRNEGYYDIVIGYYDESDGDAQLEVSHGKKILDQWTLDQQLGATSASKKTAVRRVVAEDLFLEVGDRIQIKGLEDGGEHARVDYIDFIPKKAPETVWGTSGRDRLIGTAKNDIMKALGQKDRMLGKQGDDVLYGGGGADIIKGQQGDDELHGEGGNDKLIGGSGDDLLNGGKGSDIYKGGQGCDTFVITKGRGHDFIKDFDPSCDQIALGSDIRFNKLDIFQDGKNAVIAMGRDLLAELNRFDASQLGREHFTSI